MSPEEELSHRVAGNVAGRIIAILGDTVTSAPSTRLGLQTASIALQNVVVMYLASVAAIAEARGSETNLDLWRELVSLFQQDLGRAAVSNEVVEKVNELINLTNKGKSS